MSFFIRLFVVGLFISACASGGNPSRRERDASAPRIFDAGLSVTSDAGRVFMPDSATSLDVRSSSPEICNGLDDDLDGSSDENFGCPLGRMGEICVTSCGANGFRMCETGCHWSSQCQNFQEQCDDTLDNDCDGSVDEGCSAFACEGEHVGSRIRLEALSSLGECADGWTLVLWGAGGRFEEYRSLPGSPMTVDIGSDWGGWAGLTAFCGSWEHVRVFETMTSASAYAAGISIQLDGREIGHDVLVCADPGAPLVRPFIPVNCGLDPCPGPSY